MKSKGNLFGVNYLMQNNKLCPIQIVSYLDLLFITDFLKSLITNKCQKYHIT